MHQLALVLKICQFHDKNKIIQIQIIQQIFSFYEAFQLWEQLSAICLMFLGLKPPYDFVGPLGAFLSEGASFLDSLLCLATTSMIMLSLASYVSMGGTLMSGLTVRDKYRQLKNKDRSQSLNIILSYILPCSNGIKLRKGRRQQLMSNKREVFVGLDRNTKARFWWTSTTFWCVLTCNTRFVHQS